jgi:hypothetical protein
MVKQSRRSGTAISRTVFAQVSEKKLICSQAEICSYEIPEFSFERKKGIFVSKLCELRNSEPISSQSDLADGLSDPFMEKPPP